MRKISAAAVSGTAVMSLFAPAANVQPEHPNVLLIIADDMRPELGCYGVGDVRTPNIDRFAKSATVFHNAFCNVPVSGASRASLLTGVYPEWPSRFTHYSARADNDCPQAVPVSGWFTQHGYHTVSDGKVFHHIEDHADSWTDAPYRRHPDGYDVYWAEYNRWELWMNEESGRFINPKTMRGPFCEIADVEDTAYDDGLLAERAAADLRRLKATGEPFFLACGFWKPHLPFNAPRKYWELYDRDSIPMAPNRFRPAGLPRQVVNSAEINGYARVSTPDDEAFLRELKHGYYACLSYVDAQIGKVLGELDRSGLADNTIVIILGDHGWQLGEHGFVGKHTLMERSTRVPLLVRVPWLDGGDTHSMVELVDLYPTLCELCGLPQPGEQLDGDSFVPILRDHEAETKEQVYIQWEGGDNAVERRWSYAEWCDNSGEVRGRMLFDRKNDPEENVNRADDESYRSTVVRLSSFLTATKSALRQKENQQF